MTKQRIAALIKQEVQQPTATEKSSRESSHEIATTQNTPLGRTPAREPRTLRRIQSPLARVHRLRQRASVNPTGRRTALAAHQSSGQACPHPVAQGHSNRCRHRRQMLTSELHWWNASAAFSADRTTDASLETAED